MRATDCSASVTLVAQIQRGPSVPKHMRQRGQHATHDVDVSSRLLPDPLGAGSRYGPNEWIGCGRIGAGMHDDRHVTPRWSVLLVCRGTHGWQLTGVRRNGTVVYVNATRGALIILDTHRAHGLNHEGGLANTGWAALSWNRVTLRGAREVANRLIRAYSADPEDDLARCQISTRHPWKSR